MKRDLTPAEALEAFNSLAAEVSSKCTIYAGLNHYKIKPGVVSASIHPGGVIERTTLYVGANSWRELLAACRAAWEEFGDTHAAKIIREMALAIISITADQGECSDAALRATFDAADIARYGERACAQATEIASNGPFSIVKLAGANDAEAA